MDDLLAAAKPHPGLTDDELSRQMWLTSFVIVGLFAVAAGIDFIGNGLPGFGHLLTSVGLAGLTYLTVEHGVQQHRAGTHLDHPGLTVKERIALVGGLVLIVVSAAL
jgi:hypothetical protein